MLFKVCGHRDNNWLQKTNYCFTVLHDASTAGHLGVQKTLNKLKQKFYWVGKRKDVKERCRHWDICTCASRTFPQNTPKPACSFFFFSNLLDQIAMDILRSLPAIPRGNIRTWKHTVARVLLFNCRFAYISSHCTLTKDATLSLTCSRNYVHYLKSQRPELLLFIIPRWMEW